MERFEYRVYEFAKDRHFFWEDSSQVAELNDLGMEGWEVVVIEGPRCLLKRRVGG